MNCKRNSAEDDSLLHKTANPADVEERQDDTFDPEAEALFGEIQAAWDNLGSRIDKLLVDRDPIVFFAEPPRSRITSRARSLALYLFLTLVTLSCAVYWGTLIPSLAFGATSLVACMAVEALMLLLVAECICNAVSIFSYRPYSNRLLPMSALFGAKSYPHRLAVASMAVLLAITLVSCTTTGGDGYYITQNCNDRMAVVEDVTYILNTLCSQNS